MSRTVTSIPLSLLFCLVPGLWLIVSKCEKKEGKRGEEEKRLRGEARAVSAGKPESDVHSQQWISLYS